MTRRITPDEAFQMYLAQTQSDGHRSLSNLHRRISEDAGLKTVCERTLATWSKRHEWVRRAQEHDAQLAAAVHEKTLEAQAQTAYDSVYECRATAKLMLEKVRAALAAAEVTDAAAMRLLTMTAIELTKVAEVLDGGVSDRTESHGKVTLQSELEEHLKALDELMQAEPTRH